MDYDLQNPVRQQLLNDLLSANFFNAALDPQSTFHITSTTPYTGNDSDAIAGANYLVTGDLTLVGQTHSLYFPALITFSGDSLFTQATVMLNRTEWGMTTYSDPSQQLYIYPDVNLVLQVKAGKTH